MNGKGQIEESGSGSTATPVPAPPPTIAPGSSQRHHSVDHDSPIEWLAKRVATAAGALAAVYAFAYILGYRYLSEYFQTLGAPWAIDLYGPSAIAQTPSSFGILVCVLGIGLVTYVDDFAGANYRRSLFPLWIAGAFLLAHFVTKWLLPSYVSFWWIGAGVFASLAFFWTSATFTNDVITKRGRNQATSLLLTLMALSAFLGAPLVAQIKAGNVKSNGATDLPKVSASPDDKGKPWRLIRATPDGKLIVARSTSEKALEFRVLDVTSPTSIRRAKD